MKLKTNNATVKNLDEIHNSMYYVCSDFMVVAIYNKISTWRGRTLYSYDDSL